MHIAYKVVKIATGVLLGMGMLYLLMQQNGATLLPAWIMLGGAGVGVLFLIVYASGLWRRAVKSPALLARLEVKRQDAGPAAPFERAVDCDTYIAERLKELYPTGEVLANGSFILPFVGGRSAAYYAPAELRLGIWPCEQYSTPRGCPDLCKDKRLRRCRDCEWTERLLNELKRYFDAVIDERCVHVLGENLFGEARANDIYWLKPQQIKEKNKMLADKMYGPTRFRPSIKGSIILGMISSAMAQELTPDAHCAYIETRSYNGTFDEVRKSEERGGPVLEYHPVCWPQKTKNEKEPEQKTEQPTE